MSSGIIPDDLPEDTKRRLPAILDGMKQGKSNEVMAVELGVSTYVVAHDRLLWRRSDGYEVWVYEEFQRLHAIIADESPVTAYKVIAPLLGRIIGQKIKAEIKAQGRIKVDVEAGETLESILGEYENIIAKVSKEIFERNLPEDSPRKQVDSTETPPEAD